MARRNNAAASSRQVLESLTISYDSININIKVGDDILLKPPRGLAPYVAKVTELTTDCKRGKNNNVQIRGQWYYRPEDAKGGRRSFHGKNELFLSNHVDTQSPESVEGKCKVHTFEEYLELDEVEDTDYFYRLKYDPITQGFDPDRLEV
uniref:BAH domain-containing protein n=1 Tax=Kalanchoe fedtschenkoi TaxID=63787 RepID=A0A7N0V8G9_KALFE